MARSAFKGKSAFALLGLMLSIWIVQSADAAESPRIKGAAAGVSGDVSSANYWFQKGALCSTYGNNKAAVGYFGKAIALDPRHSGAYFSQGVSYGQLGMYAKGVASINRALEIEPQNGLFYYGRARVYLLSGDKEKAMPDFRKAAQLGDEDAQAFLRKAR
jgi:tetratricopeptide (TPR) repeat protein